MLVGDRERSSEGVADCCRKYHYLGRIGLTRYSAVDGNDGRIAEGIIAVRFEIGERSLSQI